MRLSELACWLQNQLAALGIEPCEAAAETRLIFVHLGVTPLFLRLEGAQAADAALIDQIQAILKRRMQREPLQYILGSQPFCGLELRVSPEVLIPRPETEELVEMALALLPVERPVQLADLGTGSGAIALALANALRQRQYPAEIWASDCSYSALQLARENAHRYGLEEKIHWLHGDALQPFLEKSLHLDLLVSNPPYIPLSQWQQLAPEVRDYEPRLALTPGQDALRFYRIFAEQGPSLLKPGGWLLVELETALAEETRALFVTPLWQQPVLLADFSGKQRFLRVQRVGSGT